MRLPPVLSVRRSAWLIVLLLLTSILPGQASTTTTTTQKRVVTGTYTQPRATTTGTGVTFLREPAAIAWGHANEDKVTITGTTRWGSVVALVVEATRRGGPTERIISCREIVLPVVYAMKIKVTPAAGRCPDGRIVAPQDGTVHLSFHRRTPPGPKVAAPSQRWAVLVGISDYAGRTHSTIGGRNDVLVIRAALLRAGWRADHILTITESQATAGRIRGAMDWLAKVSSPQTFSLFHFSGHICIASRGPCRSGHTYLWSHDNRFIPEYEVISRMKRVQGHSWLDVAGCQAGAFQLYSEKRLFTASSRSYETSYENRRWNLSVWTGLAWDKGFVDGMAHPKRRPYRATIMQMASYGKKHAPTITREHPAGAQHPVVKGGRSTWSLYAPPGG